MKLLILRLKQAQATLHGVTDTATGTIVRGRLGSGTADNMTYLADYVCCELRSVNE